MFNACFESSLNIYIYIVKWTSLFSASSYFRGRIFGTSPAKPFLCYPPFLHWFQWGLCMRCRAQQWCLVPLRPFPLPPPLYFTLHIRSIEKPEAFTKAVVCGLEKLFLHWVLSVLVKFLFYNHLLRLSLSLLSPFILFLHRIVLKTPF